MPSKKGGLFERAEAELRRKGATLCMFLKNSGFERNPPGKLGGGENLRDQET